MNERRFGVTDRVNHAGPFWPDGHPMGYPCTETCRQPSQNGNQAHCRSCHNTFSALGYFDAHRQEGHCIKPARLGLVLEDGLWSTLEGHVARKEAGARMAKARAARGEHA